MLTEQRFRAAVPPLGASEGPSCCLPASRFLLLKGTVLPRGAPARRLPSPSTCFTHFVPIYTRGTAGGPDARAFVPLGWRTAWLLRRRRSRKPVRSEPTLGHPQRLPKTISQISTPLSRRKTQPPPQPAWLWVVLLTLAFFRALVRSKTCFSGLQGLLFYTSGPFIRAAPGWVQRSPFVSRRREAGVCVACVCVCVDAMSVEGVGSPCISPAP